MDLLDQDRKNNGNSHRGCLDIIADILEASSNGTKKTYLMYRCNLAFRQLKSYLDYLLRKNLLCTINDGGDCSFDLFKTTDKGKEFLKAYKNLMALMN